MMPEKQADPIHSKAVSDLIAKMLAERQEVLVLLTRLAEKKPFKVDHALQVTLQRFCQVLVDYMALGHFEVYQCMDETTEDSEQCRRVKRLRAELYPHIAATTQAAVAFNDRYDCEDHCELLDHLDADLSRLAERLATRIDLEDRLIAAIRQTGPAASASAG